MSYGIDSKRLKKLLDYYSPLNSGEQIKFLNFFKGEEGILRYLQTSPFQGIDSASLDQRINWFGSNNYSRSEGTIKGNSLLGVIGKVCRNFSLKVYFGVACVVAFVGFFGPEYPISWFSGVLNLLFFLLLTILFTIPQIFKYFENEKIKDYSMSQYRVKVWRNNQKKQIMSSQLVVGDIVQAQKGDFIGGDGLIIEGSITVKQPMNYKQLIVEKKTIKKCTKAWAEYQQKVEHFNLNVEQNRQLMPSPIVLGGSEVITGEARIVILCVGRFSRLGYFMNEVHRSIEDRTSQLQHKIGTIIFQISKYLILAMLLFLVLFSAKTLVTILKNKQSTVEQTLRMVIWSHILTDLASSLTLLLYGLPIMQLFGLAIGSYYIKLQIYRTSGIWYKYVRDCAKMRDISGIVFDKVEEVVPIQLVKWWNTEQLAIESNTIHSPTSILFQQKFIKSLRCKDYQPYKIGLKISSFFVGMNQRYVVLLQKVLHKFADQREQNLPKDYINNQHIRQSQVGADLGLQDINIIDKKPQEEKEVIYLKGNSQSLLKQCTHILQKTTGKITQINAQNRRKILQMIWKMNAGQQPSLITGYIQVHPNHPKFRQPGYKVVMIALIAYKQSNCNDQFESMARMRKKGIFITLMGNRSHQDTVSLSKEMGLVRIDKPSIRLRGYDFNKIVGGIICRNCKKSICACHTQNKYSGSLKNQDQFNRIYKHLNVVSQANSIQKMTLAIGFAAAQEKTCFFGTNIYDVPAMRKSVLCAANQKELDDQYIKAAAEVILPDNRLITIEKLIIWSNFYFEFCKKYLSFCITPCLVAFICSFASFLLYNNFCINLIQFLWLCLVINPILALSLSIPTSSSLQPLQEGKLKEESLLDAKSTRQISSQVFLQSVIILIILIFGSSFIPEDADEFDTVFGDDWAAKYGDQSRKTICSGGMDSFFVIGQYRNVWEQYRVHSRHMTLIFNVFVIMQFLNYFNCRNLCSRNLNLVDGFNWQMALLYILGFGLQILVIMCGKDIFGLYLHGLTLKQWAICLGLSLAVIIVGLLAKQIPYEKDKQQIVGKIWPNRSYNLAVMATVARQTLQDFEIDEEVQIKKMTNQ